MAETLSLWEFLRELVTNPGLRDWFAEDPQGALRANGLDQLSPDDVHDALVLAEDNQTADFSRDYDTGHSAISWSPPVPVAGESEHEAAVRYLNTYINQSINQQIDTGGDFDQDIDVHSVVASGDGAVVAGGDIDGSTITTDTTAFGSGDATGTTVHGDVSVGGSAFASGGSASVDDSDDSQHDVGDTHADNPVNDPFTTHVDASAHDSFDDDGEHTASHAFTDDSTHVDGSVDHLGNLDGH
jgi:hypothetical protein